jgi:hypothetical protein
MSEDFLNVSGGVLFSYAAVGSFFAGIRLLVSTTFLPFHQQAVGAPWGEIPERIRLLILALMRVAGTGAVLTGALCVLDCFPSFFGINRHLAVGVGVEIVIYWYMIYSITRYVHKRTNADTPFRASFSLFAASLIGTIIRAFV